MTEAEEMVAEIERLKKDIQLLTSGEMTLVCPHCHKKRKRKGIIGRPSILTLAQQMDLRRQFKTMPKKHGALYRFCREHAMRFDVSFMTIHRAVMG